MSTIPNSPKSPKKPNNHSVVIPILKPNAEVMVRHALRDLHKLPAIDYFFDLKGPKGETLLTYLLEHANEYPSTVLLEKVAILSKKFPKLWQIKVNDDGTTYPIHLACAKELEDVVAYAVQHIPGVLEQTNQEGLKVFAACVHIGSSLSLLKTILAKDPDAIFQNYPQPYEDIISISNTPLSEQFCDEDEKSSIESINIKKKKNTVYLSKFYQERNALAYQKALMAQKAEPEYQHENQMFDDVQTSSNSQKGMPITMTNYQNTKNMMQNLVQNSSALFSSTHSVTLSTVQDLRSQKDLKYQEDLKSQEDLRSQTAGGDSQYFGEQFNHSSNSHSSSTTSSNSNSNSTINSDSSHTISATNSNSSLSNSNNALYDNYQTRTHTEYRRPNLTIDVSLTQSSHDSNSLMVMQDNSPMAVQTNTPLSIHSSTHEQNTSIVQTRKRTRAAREEAETFRAKTTTSSAQSLGNNQPIPNAESDRTRNQKKKAKTKN